MGTPSPCVCGNDRILCIWIAITSFKFSVFSSIIADSCYGFTYYVIGDEMCMSA